MKRIAAILLAGLFILLAVGASPAVHAQTPTPEIIAGPELVIYADSEPSTLHIPAPDFGPLRSVANIQVDFLGSAFGCEPFPSAAQNAYLYAANIWSGTINSNVTIRISACWRNLGNTRILGSAGPTFVASNFSKAPLSNTYYPLALANSLAENDLITGGYEIASNFNSIFPNWHFGTGSIPPAGAYDFASVVLHEIGHGLGFSGSMCLWNGSQCSNSGSLTYSNPPYIYDRFTENAAGTPLLSLGNPSTELTAALTSAAYFDGANANAAYGDNRIPLYTPNSWAPGSSYSHLGPSFDGTANALMTYSLSPQEMIHNPGPVAMGILRDIGWSVVTVPPPAAPSALTAKAVSTSQINLGWSDNSSETGFEVYRSLNNSNWTLVTTTAANATTYTNMGLAGGTRYTYRVRAVNASGPSGYSNSANAITLGPPPAPSGLTAHAYGTARIDLTWRDNSNIESGYEIQRSPDGSKGWVTVTTVAANATGYSNNGLSAVTPYYYRVRATSAQGTSSDSNSANATTWAILYQAFIPATMR